MYDEGDDRASYHHRKSFTTYEQPRHSDQRQYQDHRRHNYHRNSVHNDGFVSHRGDMGRRTDSFNNWKPSGEDRTERWKENKGRGVYERRDSRNDDFASVSIKDGAREHDRRQKSHRNENGWRDERPQEMPKEEAFTTSEPIVDEWGREIRNHIASPSDDNGQAFRHFQPRAPEPGYSNEYYNRGDRYPTNKKRRREEQDDNERDNRWTRPSVQASSDFVRSRTPPKKPRMERSPPPHFQQHSYQRNRFDHSHGYSHDRSHPPTAIPFDSVHHPSFNSIPDAPRALATPSNPQKGVYTRDSNRITYPPAPILSSPGFVDQSSSITPQLPVKKSTETLHTNIAVERDSNPLMQAHPPVSKPITFKLTKPAKSALVKKFFQDDEDDEEEENTPAPPPQVNPTERALVAQANSQPPTQELSGDSTADKLSKKQTTPKLPPSPVSRTPSASARVDSTTTETVEDAAMDISPLDPLPSAPPTAKIHDPPLDLSNASGMAPSASQSEVPNFIPPSVEEPFEFLDLVGAGSYGKVFKARDVLQGKLVALKKIKMEGQHDGFPVTALREIKLLQSLRHENVVALQEMVVRKGAVFLSFEYVEHDLAGLLKQTEFVLKGEHIKSLAQQLCEGLAYIHGRSVLHRDLKTANLLVTSTGVLKLADFGLARFFNKRRAGQADYTNRVCTQWYRPPELMLGETMYGPEVDMWGAGCIFMELFLKRVAFRAETEIDQLQLIYSILGSPTSDYAPTLMQKPWFSLVLPMEGCVNCFREEFSILPEDALNFAERLLHMDGSQRPSAALALQDPYFTSDPLPLRPDLTSIKSDCHEFEAIRVDKESIMERDRKMQTQAQAQVQAQVQLQARTQSKPPRKLHQETERHAQQGRMLPPENRIPASAPEVATPLPLP